MNSVERNIVMRVLFLMLGCLLTVGVIALVTVLQTDASYSVPLEPNAGAAAETEEVPLGAAEMPEDAYLPVRLTFAGTCTTGAMLGSASYGTFNEMLREKGTAYFLEELSGVFCEDSFTLASCDVVLSDREELAPAARTTLEWYRGSADAAMIFADGGVDMLSLHSYHTWDYGEPGYSDTKAALETAGLAWCDHGKAAYYEQDGISVAVYCRYVDDETDADAVRNWIAGAAEHDFTAVYIVTPVTGAYQPDDARKAMFRSFAEAGADLVAGTDTARIQPVETWGDSRIVYSLGALIDGKNKYPDLYTLVLGVELQVLDGELCGVEYTMNPCRTYDADHAWHPSFVTDADEVQVLEEFLSGVRETPVSD